MASSSSTRQYDVFLSFRGVDTRKKFVSHLYSGLQSKGIITFKDDRKLLAGDSLSSELPSAIEESTFAVVVISPNYASSRWCLKELQKIMELHKEGRLKVVPIFYEVDPSDVRNQRGTFAEGFVKHQCKEEPETIQKWRKALTDAADLAGLDSRNWQDEATMICDIVGDIWKRHQNKDLTVQDGAIEPFGKANKELDLGRSLSLGSFDLPSNGYPANEVCSIGAELFVTITPEKKHRLSFIRNPAGGRFTWKVFQLSKLDQFDYHSADFLVGERYWKIAFHPKGCMDGKGNSLSMWLMGFGYPPNAVEVKTYAWAKLRLRNQRNSNHFQREITTDA